MSKKQKQYSLFPRLAVQMGLPVPTPEFQFHPTRKWRFDYAWPELKVALEVEGGFFTGGRHQRGAGALKDMEKYNEAACLGWRLIRIMPRQMMETQTFEVLKRAIAFNNK